MTDLPQPRNSFVLRIWREESENGGEGRVWRGWVQHVRSDQAVYVQDLAELIHFIEQHAGRLADVSESLPRLK